MQWLYKNTKAHLDQGTPGLASWCTLLGNHWHKKYQSVCQNRSDALVDVGSGQLVQTDDVFSTNTYLDWS